MWNYQVYTSFVLSYKCERIYRSLPWFKEILKEKDSLEKVEAVSESKINEKGVTSLDLLQSYKKVDWKTQTEAIIVLHGLATKFESMHTYVYSLRFISDRPSLLIPHWSIYACHFSENSFEVSPSHITFAHSILDPLTCLGENQSRSLKH